MTRNNMAMSFVILAILISPAARGDEFCKTLLKAVDESKTGFFSFRNGAAADNVYERKKSGWSTPFRLPNSDFCFIDNISRPSLVCNYPGATSISRVLPLVQSCLGPGWTMSSERRFTVKGSSWPQTDERTVFTNHALDTSIRVWQSAISEGVVVEVTSQSDQ